MIILIVYIMIIPVKCFTCGKVLADKYRFYQEKVREKKNTLRFRVLVHFRGQCWQAILVSKDSYFTSMILPVGVA